MMEEITIRNGLVAKGDNLTQKDVDKLMEGYNKGIPKKKKTEPEKLLLEIERYITSSVPADFYLETMEEVSKLMKRRYLR